MTIYPGVKPENLSQNSYPARKPYLGAPKKFAASGSLQPYLGSPESFIGFITAPVRFLKESVTKESAFEKPYLDTEYPTMHLNLPYPDWPSGGIPKVGNVSGRRSKLITGSGCKYCIITCYGGSASSNEACEKLNGWCHISVACTSSPNLSGPNPGDGGWSVSGPVKEIVEDSLDGIDIYPDWDNLEADEGGNKTAAFTVTYTDGLGHKCTDDFELSCLSECDCETADTFLFDDDNTPDTITPGGSISVYVTGGCPPFTWEVSGTGYSFETGETEERNNTLHCTSDEGGCGVAYEAVAEITITDNCSEVASGESIAIRNTGGQWTYLGVCVPDCNGDTGNSCTEDPGGCHDAVGDIVYGSKSQARYYWGKAAATCLADNAGNNHYPCSWLCGSYPTPPFSTTDTGYPCMPHYPSCEPLGCLLLIVAVYEWTC